MDDLNQVIAKNLITMRKIQGLTQQEFAKIFNYSDKTISKWELGYAIPGVETLKQIADYYGVTVDYFLVSHEDYSTTKIKLLSRQSRRVLILCLFDLFFLLVSVVIYVALATSSNQIYYWPAFIWAVAACFLFDALASNGWWKHTYLPHIFVSLTIWSGLLAFYFNFMWFNVDYNFWYIFFIGLPVQFGSLIILTLTRSSTRD